MPKPNCTEEIDVGSMDFGRLGRRVVQGCFDGGSMTSDGGVMLLGQVDRKLGLMDAAARCIADPRNPLLITHDVRDMLRQRVYGLALGWEDLNDHGALRCDVAVQTAVGVDHEIASAPTLCRLEKWADRATAWRLHEVLVNQFIASFESAPEELVLDFDATDNPHTHLIVRGRDDTGKDLIIAGDYIAHGFRHRAAELATEWLGPRTELEIQQTLQREVEQERWTSLDHTLQREAGDDGRVQVRRFNEPKLQRQRLLLIGRLQCLQRLGLADEAQPGTWTTHADAEKTLRALGERGDIIRTMQRAMGGQPRELAVFEPGDDGRTIIGRGPPRGWPTSCATGAIWSSTAWTARRTTSRSTPATNPQTIRPARWWKYVVPPRYGRQIAISLRWPAMGSTEPIITWQLPKVRRRPAVIRTKSLPRTFAGWKPCAGPASWNVLPRGCGRYPTTCPSVAASTMRNAWAA